MVTRDLDTFISRLKSVVPRLDISDDELMELFWQGHPRFQFFTSLPWSTNLLDLGAGSGDVRGAGQNPDRRGPERGAADLSGARQVQHAPR